MKISSKVKEQTRIRLLESAVDVISEKGFDKASMREIASRADVADATIYNYFSTKEKLLYGYCEYIQQQVMSELKSIDDFHEYSLQEQLHQLVETELKMWRATSRNKSVIEGHVCRFDRCIDRSG